MNREANAALQENIGYFGYYECINDEQAAAVLLNTAANWLKEQGVSGIRGPWNFTTQDIGFVIEGFDLPPIILSSYSPAYYNAQLEANGFKKVKDLLVYSCNTSSYSIPDRFVNFSDRIARRYHLTVRSLDMKNLPDEARLIVRLTNESLMGNWGFYPVPEEEAEQMAADLKMIIHPEVVLIAEADGQPVGYMLTLPDVNHLLKDLNGRLFPTGIFKLLRGVKKLTRYRIWALSILPEYQRKGVSILMFRRLNELLAGRDYYIEANWVLEDNALMNNALKNLQLDLVKKYRIYEKALDA